MGRPKTGSYLKCETCGKEFYVNTSRVRQTRKNGNTIRYCSMKCYKKDGDKNPFHGKKHTKESINKMLSNPDYRHFGKGEDNPNFVRFEKNTFIGWSRPWWSKWLKNNVGKCEDCGWNKHLEVLEIHHKDRNIKNNIRENLILLCPNCHDWRHYIEKTGKYNKLRK